jgi:hypothetical protein
MKPGLFSSLDESWGAGHSVSEVAKAARRSAKGEDGLEPERMKRLARLTQTKETAMGGHSRAIAVRPTLTNYKSN